MVAYMVLYMEIVLGIEEMIFDMSSTFSNSKS